LGANLQTGGKRGGRGTQVKDRGGCLLERSRAVTEKRERDLSRKRAAFHAYESLRSYFVSQASKNPRGKEIFRRVVEMERIRSEGDASEVRNEGRKGESPLAGMFIPALEGPSERSGQDPN